MKRVEINEIQFKLLIDGVKHCVEKSDYRPILQYIQIKVAADTITAYALDGYRAARVEIKIEEHSKKPDETRKRIEALYGDVPKIELFARRQADNWDCWGNEV